jgi:hypothetical protein
MEGKKEGRGGQGRRRKQVLNELKENKHWDRYNGTL